MLWFVLPQVPILYNLTEHQLWQLAGVLQSETVAKDQVVFRQGEPGDKFYIIQEGIFTIQGTNDKHDRIPL